MPVSERTIKTLFAKSQNRCAIPGCGAILVIGETVIGEICHIRARKKGGARYDPTLTETQKNAPANLILLCPTCHTLADKDTSGSYSVERLEALKAQHERGGAIELTVAEARQALALLAKHNEGSMRRTNNVKVSGNAEARADRNGVAISIAGYNQGNINVQTSGKSGPRGYSRNSIGADANLSGYVDYLCELYVRYMSPTQIPPEALWAKIGKQIKSKFRLARRSRNDLSADRFHTLTEFLREKLAATPVGRRHLRNGDMLCSSFEEWRSTTR